MDHEEKYSPDETTDDVGYKEALIKVHNLLDSWGVAELRRDETGLF